MTEAHEGTIVTFYSYKGGTGRTMALANTAWILASNGSRVLVIDWDLESPGVHKFFRPFLDPGTLGATPGVIDLITDYAFAATGVGEREPDWHLKYARVEPLAVSLRWNFFPAEGTVDFISAGRQNRDYSMALSSIDWDNFYERLGGGQFFDAMRADMKRHYDYVLIDSRTGLSDVADICTVQFPDVLVDCFTLSDQSIEGAASVARTIETRYRERNIRILPVPMRIDEAEKEKLDSGRALARAQFDRLPSGLSSEQADRYWASVEIPYRPFYAYEETLATFGDPAPSAPTSLLASFERLTDAITRGRVRSLAAMPEERRLHYQDAFARRRPRGSVDLFLSYVPEDRMWADWIAAVLNEAGFRVVRQSAGGEAGSDTEQETGRTAEAAARTVAVLSGAYVRSPQARGVWRAIVASDPAASRRQLVPVRVSDVRLAPPFTNRTLIDLTGKEAQQAIEALVRGLDQSSPIPLQSRLDRAVAPRFPGARPPVWDVPTRNAGFTGRADTLEKLRDQLSGGNQAVVLPQALYGLGGVGKTQVALEYAHRFMSDYDLVWWVRAEQRDEVGPSFARLAERLGLHVGESVSEAARAALEALRRGDPYQRWLVIYDNADDPEELKAYLPGSTGHVLVTSRNPAWSQVADPLEVGVFTRAESVEHLQRRVPGLHPADAGRVADALGDLPLAIEQAGAWLEETGMPAEDYLAALGDRLTQVLSLNAPADYPDPVAATWNLSFERLRERSPAAARMLQLCAFFAPDEIAQALIYSDEMTRVLVPYDETLREKLMLGRVMQQISRFALAKVDQGKNSIQVHRLVQAVIRSQMSAEDQDLAKHAVHEILTGARPRQGGVDNPANWPRYDWIWPHLSPSRASECAQEETRILLIDRVRYLWKRGEYDDALELGGRLERLWESELGSEHRQTLYLRFHLANVLRSQGRYQDALDLDSEVFDQQRELLSMNHPHTLMTAAGLAADYRALGFYQESLNRDLEVYAAFKELFGEDHTRTLSSANNLAESYRLVGDFARARELDQDTLDRRRAVLGPDHPYTLFTMGNLAMDIREGGEFREAAELTRRTYERYRETLGEDFPETLRTARSLSVSLRRMGSLVAAAEIAQEALPRHIEMFGPSSPDTLTCKLNLACDLAALNETRKARELAQEVAEDFRRVLGSDHPHTLIAIHNLALYLRGTRAVDEAKALATDAYRTLESRLGPEHPFVLLSAVNLASSLYVVRELDEADDVERMALAGLRQVRGDYHPDTLACEANMAITARATGRDEEARQIRDRVLGHLVDALGPDHPHVVALRRWERIDCDIEPLPW